MLFVVRGKATIANLACDSKMNERTFRRNFRKFWGFHRLDAIVMDLLDMGECIAAIDATTLPKSGCKTFGVGWFWSGSCKRVKYLVADGFYSKKTFIEGAHLASYQRDYCGESLSLSICSEWIANSQ